MRAHIRTLQRVRVAPVNYVYKQKTPTQLATVVRQMQEDARKERALCDAIGVPYVAVIH